MGVYVRCERHECVSPVAVPADPPILAGRLSQRISGHISRDPNGDNLLRVITYSLKIDHWTILKEEVHVYERWGRC